MDVERRLAKLNTASDQQRQFYRWNRVDATDSIIVELSSRGVRRKVRNVEILVERCSSLPDISSVRRLYTRDHVLATTSRGSSELDSRTTVG